MKKKLLVSALAAIAGVGLVAGSSFAGGIYEIEFTGTDVFTSGQNASLAINHVDAAAGDDQNSAIYGAGFMMNTDELLFNADLYTWDSYSAPGLDGPTGWWDAFIVNVNQEGYYWDVIGSLNDPLVDDPNYAGGTPTTGTVLPGNSWVWGGADYGPGTDGDGLEHYISDVTTFLSLTLVDYDPTKEVYVSFVLDTITPPNDDTNYASWGNFQAKPVPEPATMLLFGTGLAGLAGAARRRKKK